MQYAHTKQSGGTYEQFILKYFNMIYILLLLLLLTAIGFSPGGSSTAHI
jgi:hypothetical protein